MSTVGVNNDTVGPIEDAHNSTTIHLWTTRNGPLGHTAFCLLPPQHQIPVAVNSPICRANRGVCKFLRDLVHEDITKWGELGSSPKYAFRHSCWLRLQPPELPPVTSHFGASFFFLHTPKSRHADTHSFALPPFSKIWRCALDKSFEEEKESMSCWSS